MSDFGTGLGQVIGAHMGSEDLTSGLNSINNNSTGAIGSINSNSTGAISGFNTATSPYNTFGQSFMPAASQTVGAVQGSVGSTQGYDQFMQGYTNTPAARYQLQQADAVQNNSAAARGGLLSGANERALGTINNGIVAGNANTAYNEYLAGNNQQFGQLESALGNMFSAIGIGQTATGQQGGVLSSITGSQNSANAGITSSQNTANANIAAAQAKNDQSKGSGIGSMFGGLGSIAAMF